MSSAEASNDPTIRKADDKVEPTPWPLKFKAHNFDAYCFSTYGCKVVYKGLIRVNDSDEQLKVDSAVLKNYPKMLEAGMGPIGNFPAPAKVSWRSKDGVAHEAEVDIGSIFKDELIRHSTPREEATDVATDGLPGVILEVNDRTINVYMRAMIWTKKLRNPDNPHSNFNNDLIKVYSKTY